MNTIKFTYSIVGNHQISSICCLYFKIEGLSQEKQGKSAFDKMFVFGAVNVGESEKS